MILSEILNRYFVLPLNQSELVCFSTEDHPEHGEIIVVTWNDSDTLDNFRQEFVDQEVDLSDAVRFKGQFNVTPIGDGDPVAFIALDAVSFEELSKGADVKTLSEFMAEQEALHPGIHDKVRAAADELRTSLAQQDGGERTMSNAANNGGPAFPGQWYDFQPHTGEQVVREQWEGMTLRDYFATRMMVSELTKEISPHKPYNYLNAATRAYRMADAMLKARETSSFITAQNQEPNDADRR